MRKLLAVFALLLAGSGVAWADGLQQVVNSTTQNPQWTVTVFNDNGSSIVSGDVVSWDDDDTDFSTSMYPYVSLSGTADDPYVAGVVAQGLTCADQNLCEIVVYGPAMVKVADATDAITADNIVSTSSVAGRAGDAGQGGNTCSLGMAIAVPYADDGTDGALARVFVNITCD